MKKKSEVEFLLCWIVWRILGLLCLEWASVHFPIDSQWNFRHNPVILVLILFLGRWKNWRVCLNTVIKCLVLDYSVDKSLGIGGIHTSCTGMLGTWCRSSGFVCSISHSASEWATCFLSVLNLWQIWSSIFWRNLSMYS